MTRAGVEEQILLDSSSKAQYIKACRSLLLAATAGLFYFWAQMEQGRREAQVGVWCIKTSEPDAAQP